MSTCAGCAQPLALSPVGLMSCDTSGCPGNLTEIYPPPDDVRVTLNGVDVSFEKLGYTISISRDTAMDYGLIPDDRPPVKIPRRTRWRWWWQAHRPRLHFGPCPTDDEEDW